MEQLERVGILRANATTCKDDKFAQIFIDPESKDERNVEVNAIRADWVFKTEEGTRFLEQLSESDDMSLFTLDSVQTLVFFQWRMMRPVIIRYLFLPFLVYFFLFIMSISFFYENKDEYPWLNTLIAVCVIPFIAYFGMVEVIQFKS